MKPGMATWFGGTLLGLLAPAAPGRSSPPQDPKALLERLYGREPGEWAKGLLVQLRLEEHPATLQLYLAASGEARLQTEGAEGRIWDLLGPEGAWRCQPREIFALQGRPRARLELLRQTFGLLALWPLLRAEPRAEGGILLEDGGCLELELGEQGHPVRFVLRPSAGPTLELRTTGPRQSRTPSSPAWPEGLEARLEGQDAPLRIRLVAMRPFAAIDPRFFQPRRGLRIHGKLLPDNHPLNRLLLSQEEAGQAAVLPATEPFLERQGRLLLVGEALVAAGFTLNRLPAYVHEPDGWRLLVPFAGEGPIPKGLERRDLPAGTYARIFVEGPWDEGALRGVLLLERLLRARNLAPAGPVQIIPLRRPGFLLMPFEEEERITEIRVHIEG